MRLQKKVISYLKTEKHSHYPSPQVERKQRHKPAKNESLRFLVIMFILDMSHKRQVRTWMT